MTRFIAFSDLHAHPFPYGADFVPYPPFKGLHNSRLVSTMRALSDMADYAVANNIEVVLFGGDMFHTRQSVKTVARNMVTHVIKEKFVDQGLKLVMIPGNHDYSDRVGHIHSLQPLSYLSDNVYVLDTVQALEIADDLVVISVPYTDSVKKARKDVQFAAQLSKQHPDKQTVLLAHLGVQGATVGSDYVMLCPSDVAGQEIPFNQFDICLFGHYHQHQLVSKNAWFIGALTQQNWSDVNGKRGFIDSGIISSSDVLSVPGSAEPVKAAGNAATTRAGAKVQLHRIDTGAPRFVVCTTEKELDEVREKDFVTYLTTKTLTDIQQKKLRARCKAGTVDIKPVKKDGKVEVQLDAKTLNAETALEPWVKAHGGDLDQDVLLKLGNELLAVGSGSELS